MVTIGPTTVRGVEPVVSVRQPFFIAVITKVCGPTCVKENVGEELVKQSEKYPLSVFTCQKSTGPVVPAFSVNCIGTPAHIGPGGGVKLITAGSTTVMVCWKDISVQPVSV
jgi:hypothetical protein